MSAGSRQSALRLYRLHRQQRPEIAASYGAARNRCELQPHGVAVFIGGMATAAQGMEALMDGRYPGKIVIFPQLTNLPLMAVDELPEKLPQVASKLGPGGIWTNEAEAALFETVWHPGQE